MIFNGEEGGGWQLIFYLSMSRMELANDPVPLRPLTSLGVGPGERNDTRGLNKNIYLGNEMDTL